MRLFNHYEKVGDLPTASERREKLERTICGMREDHAAGLAAWEQNRRDAFPGRLARFSAWVAAQDHLTADDKAEIIAGFL